MLRSAAEVVGWIGVGLFVLSLAGLALGALPGLIGLDRDGLRDPMGWWILRKFRRIFFALVPVSLIVATLGFYFYNHL